MDVKPARHTAAERIAKRLNKGIKAGAVTTEQIALVISGHEKTESHPVIATIKTECRKAGLMK